MQAAGNTALEFWPASCFYSYMLLHTPFLSLSCIMHDLLPESLCSSL